MKKSRFSLGWFLFGLGSHLQIAASLSMTELFVLFASVKLLLSGEYQEMRRTGVHKLFWLAVLVLVGCSVNYLYFGAPSYYVIRRFAQVSLFVCAVPFANWMLRRRMSGFRWMFVGGALSNVICIFIFKKAVEVSKLGGNVEDIVSGPLFWIQRISSFLSIPYSGWYLQTPIMYSILAPLAFTAFCVLSSASGRSVALANLASVVLVIIGGKRVRQMKMIKKTFFGLCLAAFVSIPIVTAVYGQLASSGMLGEMQQKKYEGQTKGRKGVMALIMGGRIESIVPLYACLHHPLMGFGLEGRDNYGYWEEFIGKYGKPEDVDSYYLTKSYLAKLGVDVSYEQIPTHTVVGAFWTYYGILGLIFWIYMMFVFLRYVREDSYVIPQWYFWLVCSLPIVFWDIFFSPVTSRIGHVMMAVACLYARAIRKGRRRLPVEMAREIQKYAK